MSKLLPFFFYRSMGYMDPSALGRWAEKQAAAFLADQGYTIIESNYRKPWGEIDLVASKEGIMVFVEVKANQHQIAGFEPELRADWKKREKVIRTARTYLLERKLPDTQEWQIDVISVMLNKQKMTATIKHFKNT